MSNVFPKISIDSFMPIFCVAYCISFQQTLVALSEARGAPPNANSTQARLQELADGK